LSGWADYDTGAASTTIDTATFPGESWFKMDAGSVGGGDKADQRKDAGTFGNVVVASVKLYHEAIGVSGDNFVFSVRKSSVMLNVSFASDGLFVHDGSGWNEVGTNIVQVGTGQEWTFKADFTTPASATVDVYLNGALHTAGVDCSYTGSETEGEVRLRQKGAAVDQISFVDWVKVGDDFA